MPHAHAVLKTTMSNPTDTVPTNCSEAEYYSYYNEGKFFLLLLSSWAGANYRFTSACVSH